MIQLSRQPYERKYTFSIISLTNFFRTVMYGLAILIPFFIVFSIPYFYQASNSTFIKPSFALNSYYYVMITASKVSSSNLLQLQDYRYTNFQDVHTADSSSLSGFTNNPPPLKLQVVQENQNFTQVKLSLTKDLTIISNANGYQKINKVFIMLGAIYKFNQVQSNGLIICQSMGYDLAQIGFAGRLIMKQGRNISNYPLNTSQLFSISNFNLANLTRIIQSQSSYLKYEYSDLPINYLSDTLEIRLFLNKQSIFIYQDQNVTIFGQFIWSWVQYCPIAICALWIVTQVMKFFMREGILKRNVFQDKQWQHVVKKQK